MTRVIDHAGELARIHDASVHVLYVVDTASLTTMPMDASLDGIHGLMQEEGNAAVEEAQRRMPDGVDVDRTVAEGAPAAQIIDCAGRRLRRHRDGNPRPRRAEPPAAR